MALWYVLTGILIGWIVEWVIDVLYWRGQVAGLRTELEGCHRHLADEREQNRQLRTKMVFLEEEERKLQARIRALEGEADQLKNERDAALQELRAVQTAPPENVEPDDLKVIEGIGPKIERLLNDAGILTFAQLARTSVERLRAILQEAGPRFRLADPTTWPRQAGMAAEGRWDELKDYQDALQGGREG